jgi:putative tricarboxylic transport membrane protein
MVGAYAIQQSVLDIWIMFISGVIGFFLTKYGFPISPVALGLILGPIMEQSFGLTMIMFHGNFLLILTRPLAIVFFALTIFSILWPFISGKIFKGKTMEAPAA